jgi:hypothetical protein
MKFPFEGDWEALSDLAVRGVPSAELEHQAEKLVQSAGADHALDGT